MKITYCCSIIALLCSLSVVVAPPAEGQECTLGLPVSFENDLNTLLLGACERHDACWRTKNPCGGPYLGLTWKAGCDVQFLADLTGVCTTATTLFAFPNPDFSSVEAFAEACEAGAAAAYAGVSVNIPGWHSTQCTNGCNLEACQALGLPLPYRCCFSIACQCFTNENCDFLPSPEWGTWECLGCRCVLTNSPLVLHLPDYYSSMESGRKQNWWKDGFCGSEGSTICLDWRGDGTVTCTAWTDPNSGVSFLVNLSASDVSDVAIGLPVRAEPSRHFFGNVTRSPDGENPFANGYEALAEYCGQDPVSNNIDFTECGTLLHVWTDLSTDGYIDPGELTPFGDLGIVSLGKVQRTGKRDRCGNTFSAEAHAICFDRPGTCGTWIDAFCVSRYPEAPRAYSAGLLKVDFLGAETSPGKTRGTAPPAIPIH